jgi:hypothetical protein
LLVLEAVYDAEKSLARVRWRMGLRAIGGCHARCEGFPGSCGRLAIPAKQSTDEETDVQERARAAGVCTDKRLLAGFSDQSQFTRVFKRHTGFTPGAFRRIAGSTISTMARVRIGPTRRPTNIAHRIECLPARNAKFASTGVNTPATMRAVPRSTSTCSIRDCVHLDRTTQLDLIGLYQESTRETVLYRIVVLSRGWLLLRLGAPLRSPKP